jgi:hypothetical protein
LVRSRSVRALAMGHDHVAVGSPAAEFAKCAYLKGNVSRYLGKKETSLEIRKIGKDFDL